MIVIINTCWNTALRQMQPSAGPDTVYIFPSINLCNSFTGWVLLTLFSKGSPDNLPKQVAPNWMMNKWHSKSLNPSRLTQGQWPRGATPCPRPGVATQRSYTISKERWLCGWGRAQRSYSMFKIRRGGCEEIPLIQGKEQRLRFAGAALKRYPTSAVRETQVRP